MTLNGRMIINKGMMTLNGRMIVNKDSKQFGRRI
jgi:hypothetical protein